LTGIGAAALADAGIVMGRQPACAARAGVVAARRPARPAMAIERIACDMNGSIGVWRVAVESL